MAYAQLPISTLVKPALRKGGLILSAHSIRPGPVLCRYFRGNR